MIVLAGDAASWIVSAMVIIAIGWAVYLSVGAAANEAAWARRQIRNGGFGILMLGTAGALALIWVRPIWVGVAGLYIAGIVWVMSRSVRSSLRRVEVFGGAAISDSRRRELLARTARWMGIAAAVLLVLSVVDLSWRGPVALADLILAFVFAVASLRARQLAVGRRPG